VDPNFTGAILATFTILFLVAKKYFTSLVLIITLALTFSRASYLSLMTTLVPLVTNKKYLKFLWVVPLLALVVYFSPKPFGEGVNLFRTYSIFSRVESVNNGIQLFLERPLSGMGFGALTSIEGAKVSVDNSYVYLLASSGLLGLLSFVSVLFAILKATKKDTYLLLLPILIHALFNNSFFYIWIMSLFWVIVGYSFKENKSA
jgi:O-antigen ligase